MTQNWISQNSKLIDQIFQQDPLLLWLRDLRKRLGLNDEIDEFEEEVKYARAEYGRNLWDAED